MDVFVFPSRTDTFGLVVLEALASGVPAVVSPETGVRAGVRHGVTGFYAEDSNSFTQGVLYLMTSEAVHREMSSAARDFAGSKTWHGVFEQLYLTYETGLEAIGLATSGASDVAKGHDDYPARSAVLD
jgi:phosphatidylinositol alpha 1,6-mannosyltransferase